MVSPELLRRYPFFNAFDETEIGDLAMISESLTYQAGDTLVEVEQPADSLYLLMEGSIELWYVAVDRHEQDLRKEFYLNDMNPGEVIGISAIIEPYVYTATALVTSSSQLIKVDGPALRALCQRDQRLEAGLMRRIAKVAMDRLHDTRVQLLAARA